MIEITRIRVQVLNGENIIKQIKLPPVGHSKLRSKWKNTEN